MAFIGFFTMGLALPVLPLHVHETLGMSATIVGVVAGSQFAAALLSRLWSGLLADAKGPKLSMQVGLVAVMLGGALYHVSVLPLPTPLASLALLILARLMIGCAESFIVTGALAWGVALIGAQNAGRVIAWAGIAIYGAYAAAAPVGVWIYGHWGFAGIATATILVPLLGHAGLAPLTGAAPSGAHRAPFYTVLGAVLLPGLGLALICTGLGSLTAFVALLFTNHGWQGISIVFTVFGISFVVPRVFFSGLPDRIGGAKVALVCVLIETVGQFMIWPATSPPVVYIGSALTGFGYSLAFVGFGVEAVRRAPPQSRGMAMGAYVAFLDISLGVMGPVLGAIGSRFGISAVYLAATGLIFAAFPITVVLLRPAGRSAPARG
jgi:MFS family permease